MFSPTSFLPKPRWKTSADVMNGPNQNPNAETKILHLHTFAPGTPLPASADESINASAIPPEMETPSPELMISVDIDCYSKGDNDPADSRRESTQNHAPFDATSNDIPQPASLQRFRQFNSEMIQVAVQKTLRSARKRIKEALWPSNPFRSDGTSSFANSIALDGAAVVAPRDETEGFASRKVSERIDKAGCIDGLSM